MLLAKYSLLMCVLVLGAVASDIGLIRVGENWAYFKGVTEPPAVSGRRWIDPAYPDGGWLTGRAGFSTPGGYGEATIFFDYGQGYRTIFFRKNFTVTNPTNVAELLLRIDYDDGLVAYLNGQEVARRGVAGPPGALVPITATAAYHPRATPEVIALTNTAALLRRGTNLLAVQLISSSTFDPTFSFVPELIANVIRGPYLQNMTFSSTQIIWKTLSPAASKIEFGTNVNALQELAIAESATEHLATLSGLRADTEYVYRVMNRFGAKETYTDWKSFRTFKQDGAVNFDVVGDSGWGSMGQILIADQMERSSADFLMHVGDLVYPAISHQNEDLRLFSVYREQMRKRPWFLAIGNHEMYLDPQAALQGFFLPTNTVTGTEHYYSFEQGDAHFTVAWSDMAAGSEYKVGSPQYSWLDADLAQASKPWKFLFFHHTWRTSSAHQVDDYDVNGVRDSVQLDEALAGLARKHGVQIIFNGHDHSYERFAPSGGPISIISGGGGAVLYNLGTPHPDSVQYYSAHEFLRVKVDGDETLVETVGQDGNVFDQVHVRRSFSERIVHKSAWNSPMIETEGTTDADGNLFGQRFDFTGDALQGPMGLSSSTGRLFVNNDAENVYFGFDEVMLHPGEELLLFVEVPTMTGQASLAEIGDGIADPVGEGVDALDFLANVSFENFAPAVGVILGDEFADAASRDFRRAGQEISSGQGAFLLRDGLPTVPGQRLAQFNRSPQQAAVAYEQNADYIELAIPFSALGNLKPGDVIRVGALTGLGTIETNATLQTRRIDSGGIGSSVRVQDGKTFLDGIAVRLVLGPDADGDDLIDADELIRGTNPNDPDSDDDGLPDGWEVEYSLNPLLADETADADADDFSNGAEFRAGTDPRDAASRLALQAANVSGNKLRLSWNAIIGKRYQLQARENLAESFRNVEDPVFPKQAQAAVETYSIDFSPDLLRPSRYYRVQLVN